MNRSIIKSICPPFNVERKLKADIADYFFSDAHYYLQRSKLVYNNPYAFEPFLPVEIKNFVDMLFCAECSLKSIIMSLSPHTEKPEIAYKTLRNFSHNLEKLCDEVVKRAKNRLKFLNQYEIKFLTNANKLGVDVRYSLEFYLERRKEEFYEKATFSGEYSQWLKRENLKKFIDVNETLLNISKKSNKRYCKNNRNYTMNNADKYDERLNSFLKNWGSKTQKK